MLRCVLPWKISVSIFPSGRKDPSVLEFLGDPVPIGKSLQGILGLRPIVLVPEFQGKTLSPCGSG